MIMFSFAWRCSSFTHAFALSSDACNPGVSNEAKPTLPIAGIIFQTYRLRDIIYNNGTVGISVVHGGKRLVSLLSGRIPNLKLDRRVLIEGDGLSKESRSNGGFSEGVELILTIKLAILAQGL